MTHLKFILLLAIGVLVSCKQNLKAQGESPKKVEITLTKLWETDTLLQTCEAVRYDSKKNIIYVSNIGGMPAAEKDGDGTISILNENGEILNQNWVTGLNAPKGLNFFGSKLYVTDIDEIVRIDIETGAIEKKFKIENAIFLNDLDIDTNGDVYVTDSRTGKVHKLANEEVTLWVDLEGMSPNGIFVEKDRILIVSNNKGDFMAFNKKTKARSIVATGIVGGDGIVSIKEGYFVSTWPGELFFVENNEAVKIQDTKEQKLNTADIGIIPGKNILLVPTFFGNKVIAYKINTSYK